MSTPTEGPGTSGAAESPTQDGYGNDTGFAEEAERGEQEAQATDEDTDQPTDDAQDG